MAVICCKTSLLCNVEDTKANLNWQVLISVEQLHETQTHCLFTLECSLSENENEFCCLISLTFTLTFMCSCVCLKKIIIHQSNLALGSLTLH